MKLFIWIRSFIATVLFLMWTGFIAFTGIVLNFIFSKRGIDNKVVVLWGKISCWLFNVKVKVYGIDNLLSVHSGAILLFNHSSFMDVLAMAGYLNNIRFGAKIELFKIPLFGLCMKRFGTLPIARHNKEEVFRVYQEAQVRFRRAEKFALSPEGGRHVGRELSSFKAGPFVFAMNAHVPLIPVVIKGAYNCWPKGSLLGNPYQWSSLIEVHILPACTTEHLNANDKSHRLELQNQIYHQMNTVFTH